MSQQASTISSKITPLFEDGNQSFYRKAFALLSYFLLLFMPIVSADFGITFDEWNMSAGGILALRYLTSWGENREIIDYIAGIHPQLFYSVTGFVHGFFNRDLMGFIERGLYSDDQNLVNFFRSAHFMNALFGFAAMFYTGRLLKEVASWRAALIGLLLIAVSPRFFGHSMNNSKDIPFAATYIMSLFYMVRFLKALPKPDIKTCVLLAVGLAAAVGVRAGGYLLFCYLGLFCLITWWLRGRPQREAWDLKQVLPKLATVLIGGYLGGLIFWPYAHQNILLGPLNVLKEMANFTLWDGSLLYGGAMVKGSELPWHYLPRWLTISNPLLWVVGIIAAAALAPKWKSKFDLRIVALIAFAGLFPILFIIIKKSIIYDGWRHVLFTYPPLVVMAVLPFEYLFGTLKRNLFRYLFLAVLAIGIVVPLNWMIKNHPNQYVYFNETVGGIDGAFTNYETDYFGNCMREASEFIIDYHGTRNPYKPLLVRSSGNIMSTYPYLKKEFGRYYIPFGYPIDFMKKNPHMYVNHPPYLIGPKSWDYAIVWTRGWERGALLKEGMWPPQPTIYEVKVDNTTLCAVVKNPGSKLK